MRYLIVTADDFGLTKGLNEGIARACRDGIVKSVSILPTGQAFDDALNLLDGMKLDGVGAHLSLTETTSLSNADKIPSIINKDKRFYGSHKQFLAKLFMGRVEINHIRIELRNQLDRITKTGLKITNLNSHEHIHMIPQILEVFVELAKEYKIPSIRYLRNDKLLGRINIPVLYKFFILAHFAGRMKEVLDRAGILYADNFLGFFYSGALSESILIKMLEALDEGTTELVCHPGFLEPELFNEYKFHRNCEEELFALTSRRVKDVIKKRDIKLINYEEFLSKR